MLALPTTATTNTTTSTRHLYYIYISQIWQDMFPTRSLPSVRRIWMWTSLEEVWPGGSLSENEGLSLLMLKCYRWDRSAHSWVIQEALLITPTTPKWFSKKDSQMLEFPYFLSIFPWFMDRNHTIVQLNPRVISNMAKKTAKHCYSVGSKLTIDPHWSW